MDKCPFCDNSVKKNLADENTYFIECEGCGLYKINDYCYRLESFTDEEKIKLRYHYAKLQVDDTRRTTEFITKENKDEFLNKIDNPPSSLLVKIDLVLEYIYNKTLYFGQEIIIKDYIDYRLFFCKNSAELKHILSHLRQEEYMTFDMISGLNLSDYEDEPYNAKLTSKGIQKVEESGKNPKSNQCFVAMWFSEKDPNMQKIYTDVIKPAIEGNSSINKDDNDYGTGYKAMKIDNKEHINYITDEIIKEIRRSKFMVADLTGNRGGVYYEAGFAFGLGIPVIFTCNEKWKDEIHFDVKQKNMIFWEEEKPEEFKKALINRIGAVVGVNENKIVTV